MSWLPIGASPTGEVERRPLLLFLVVRMAIGLCLVCIVPFVEGLPSSLPIFDPRTLLIVGLGCFGLWAVSALAALQHGHRPGFVWAQLVMDACLATALVQLTSGPRSALFVLYVATISAAGVLVSPNAALMVAVLDTALFLGSSLVINSVMPAQLWEISSFEMSYELVLRCFALLLIGMLLRLPYERVRVVRAEQSAVLDEVSAGVVSVDRVGRIARLNPAAKRLLGAREGSRLRDVLQPQDERWEQVLRQGAEVRHLLCSRSPLETGGEVVLIEDITRLKSMEADLEREERLAAVGRLTAALAHEIRNPLTSLSGAAQLLAEERPDPLHDIVLREVRRINGLVEELLDQARPMSLSVIPADPRLIIDDVVQAVRLDPRFRDRIDVQIACDELPQVSLDPGRFKQVLWNLMLNAVQAIPDRGTVTVRALMQGEELLVRVEDSGVGIPPEALHRLFDPFFTTRVGGTGLGLATVHRIVTGHGGTIAVQSEPGQGTTFILRFPSAPPAEDVRLVG